MKKIVYVALLCSLLSAFTGCDTGSSPSHVDARRAALSVMAKADSLMRTRPDSALKLLYSLTPEGKPFPLGEGWGEAYYLLLLDAQNKCDTVFRSDTLQRALVSYYDRHGTPNERMRAYYLLGRACHDMGEVPKALDSYLTAISVADTAKADCDYYHLCRVYGQMAEIFHQQFLPEDEMWATKQSEHYAWLAKDTLEALVAYELRIRPYYLRNKMDSVLYITEIAQNRYRKYGYNYKAARALFTSISILLDRHQYGKARECMERYEKESRLFDAHGNIAKGRELYYYYKGIYMQAMHQTDSALYYYRKVLNTGNDETAYKGLLSIFEATKNTDSIVKYSRLFTEANDTALLNYQRHTLRQTSAISSFGHYQKQKDEVRLQYLQYQGRLRFMVLLIVLILLCGYLLYRLQLSHTLAKIQHLTHNYENTRIALVQLQTEQQQLRSDYIAMQEHDNQNNKKIQEYKSLLQQKSSEVTKLQGILNKQQTKLRSYRLSYIEAAFRQTDIYKRFNHLRKFKKDYIPPGETDFENLVEAFFHYFPHYYKLLKQEHSLREEQLRVSILVILGFKTDEIVIFTSKIKQQVAQTKGQVNYKIFKTRDASLLKANFDAWEKEKLS